MPEATEYWLSPMNRVRWLKAFRSKAKVCTLRDGRKFKIRYERKKLFSHNGMVDIAVVTPTKGFVPTGQFRMEKVTDKSWIMESSVDDSPGLYEAYLDEFINSDLQGVSVVEQWPSLEGKRAATQRRGFGVAKINRGKKAEGITVANIEGTVFLLKEPEND